MHYYAKILQSVIGCADLQTENINIYVINDCGVIKNAKVIINLHDTDGGLLYEKTLEIDIEPSASMKVFSDRKDKILDGFQSENVLRTSVKLMK